MTKLLIPILLVLTVGTAQAQFIKEKAILAQIGYGMSGPDNADNVVDSGFLAQAELILKTSSWFELRPYAGFIITSAGGEDLDGNPTDVVATSKAFLLGGKARLKAPIPWVAPFIELGLGTSIGAFRTITFVDDIDKSAIIHHVPFALGVSLGKTNPVDISFSYYFQPAVEQFAGAATIGLTIPLNN